MHFFFFFNFFSTSGLQEDKPHTMQTACHTSVQKHIFKKDYSQKIKPIYLTKIQVTNTFDDKVGNFSKNLRMEFRSVS